MLSSSCPTIIYCIGRGPNQKGGNLLATSGYFTLQVRVTDAIAAGVGKAAVPRPGWNVSEHYQKPIQCIYNVSDVSKGKKYFFSQFFHIYLYKNHL